MNRHTDYKKQMSVTNARWVGQTVQTVRAQQTNGCYQVHPCYQSYTVDYNILIGTFWILFERDLGMKYKVQGKIISLINLG